MTASCMFYHEFSPKE